MGLQALDVTMICSKLWGYFHELNRLLNSFQHVAAPKYGSRSLGPRGSVISSCCTTALTSTSRFQSAASLLQGSQQPTCRINIQLRNDFTQA